MKSRKSYGLIRSLFSTVLIAALSACGGGSSTGSGGGSTGTTYAIGGQAQKGPLGIGSAITVNELNGSLSPTGKVYNVQTSDNMGDFAVASGVGSKLVEVVGTGYYLDELTGKLSTGLITIRAVVDLTVTHTPTVNVLTTLQEQRLKALISTGYTYAAANTQSQNEVLALFGINLANVNSLSTFYSMQINGTTDQDSVLLATSAILSQMATNAATANGTTQATELSNYINTIAAALASTGTYTNATFIAARNLAETQINVSAVKNNLVTYYANQGVAISTPLFQEWVDTSNSGVLPQRWVPPDAGLAFTNVTGVQMSQPVTSNTITVVGLPTGVNVALSVNAGTTIIKNGVTLTTQYSTTTNGDTIVLKVTSGGSGVIKTVTLNAGSSTYTWTVTTVTNVINVAYGMVSGGAGPWTSAGTAETSMYFAFPITTTTSFVSQYVGIGLYPQTSFSFPSGSTIAIYSDTASKPGTTLATPSSMGNYLGGTTVSGLNAATYSLPCDPGVVCVSGGVVAEASFTGSGGISLTANTPYWVVVNPPTAIAIQPLWQGVGTTPSPRVIMKSSDGVNWVNLSYPINMPLLYLTN